jgi:hypothetical protein
MHRKVLLAFAAIVYYALAAYGLYTFEAGLILTSLVLFGLPAYMLARYSAAPSAVLVAVITLGAGIAILLEGVAHIYGIWYTIGVDELRLFGLIPVEVFLCSILQTLFLALLYELIFDDGEYSTSKSADRFTAFGVFGLCVLMLIGIHQYLLQGIFFTHSYLWILGILVASSLATLAVHKALSLQFFDRLAAFCAVASLPLLIGAILSITNTHKVFAHINDYLYTFNLGGDILPLEEILLILVMPIFVATFYELYLDDGKLTSGE